jgi:hypothetical protein
MRERFIHRGLLPGEASNGVILGEATKSVSKTLDEATRTEPVLVEAFVAEAAVEAFGCTHFRPACRVGSSSAGRRARMPMHRVPDARTRDRDRCDRER